MPEWTKEQKLAIEKSGCDLLVSAAAGSGKTAVLSQRVLKRITEDKVSVDKLLIVTFTDAAASEMRQRIVDKLRAELLTNHDTEYISRQLALVPKANITTIHSFCLSIIKNNFHLLDMDPSFGIMTEADKLLALTKVSMDTINDMYLKYGEDFSLLLRWLSDGNDEDFAQRINHIYNFIQGMENPLGWLDEKVEEYNLKDTSCEELSWVNIIKQKYRVLFADIIADYQDVLKCVTEAGAHKSYEIYAEELFGIEKLAASCSGTIDDMINAAQEVNFPTVRKEKDADAYLQDVAKKSRDILKAQVKDIIKEINYLSEKNIVSSIKETYPRLVLLAETVKLYDRKYNEVKKEKNLIDFNDFEHLSLQLLQDESLNIADGLRDKYEEIYVDEYQDCNSVQEAIFACISKKTEGKSCNMFMVGDIKQSIYKFRQAEPGIFIDKFKKYSEDGIQSKIVLNKNFRSRDTVVNCVNNLFSAIMNPTVGGIEYTDEESLVAGFKYPDSSDVICGGPAEIMMVSDENAEPGTVRIALEARAIGKKINEMVGKYQVYDTKLGGYRPSTYKDFAVLMRSPSGKSIYIEEEFKNMGIPYFSDNSDGLFDVHEVDLLISALEITDNPLQDIPLIGFMRSLPGRFDEDQLLTIRQYQKKGYFYNAVKKCAEDTTELSEKCVKFLQMLKHWRKYSKTTSIAELIWKIIDDTAILPYIQALPGGKTRRANIELFIEYGRQFEKSDSKGLFSFLRFVEKLEKGKGSETAKMLSDACDVVRIMSIHKSKGLEFPIVFIAYSGGNFINADWTASGIILHKEFGIGCDFLDLDKKIRYPLISKQALSYKIKLDTLSEEMRVLYVALTRAREKLFVVASGKSAFKCLDEESNSTRDKINLNEIIVSDGFFEWICLGMRKENLWEITHYSVEDLYGEEEIKSKDDIMVKADKEIYEEINRRICYEYPYKSAVGISSKYSVTELKNRFDVAGEDKTPVFNYYEERLPKFMQQQKLTASAMGTILHLILKFVDFKKEPDEAIKECKEMLVTNNFITKEEFENAKTEVIAEFLKTDVCKDICGADKLYREIPFNINVRGNIFSDDEKLKDETVLLQGIIDCLYVKGDSCYVLDYKFEGSKLTDETIVNMYKNQLMLYKIAAEKITGKKVSATYLYLLGRGKLLEV